MLEYGAGGLLLFVLRVAGLADDRMESCAGLRQRVDQELHCWAAIDERARNVSQAFPMVT